MHTCLSFFLRVQSSCYMHGDSRYYASPKAPIIVSIQQQAAKVFDYKGIRVRVHQTYHTRCHVFISLKKNQRRRIMLAYHMVLLRAKGLNSNNYDVLVVEYIRYIVTLLVLNTMLHVWVPLYV